MVAVINNQGGFYRTEVYVHETRMSGGIIHTPCVNQSEFETTLYGVDVYLGFMHLQSIESKIATLIPEEREKNGEYASLEDFVNRIPIGIEGLPTLIFISAFPTITIHKMAKMPFIPDPRYSHSTERQYDAHRQIREDVSMTQRAPYPQAHEIGLPRFKMKT